MKLSEANRPLRVFDKAMNGGLGAGNIGVLMSRHGTGKVSVLTSITLDHAMNLRKVLHVALGKSVSDVRAFQDEVLQAIIQKLDVAERPDLISRVERHRQIYTYTDGSFSLKRTRDTLELLANHAEFRPEIIDIQGWPDFEKCSTGEFSKLKKIAQEFETELWLTAHTHRDAPQDERGVPPFVSQFEEYISVLIGLEPVQTKVRIKFVKTHDTTPPQGIHLEFDPITQLIHWT